MFIIPIGDHCAPSLLLKELNYRKYSYPFDWVSSSDINKSNIIYNIQLIEKIKNGEEVVNIVNDYIGNAFTNNNINSNTNIEFPHEKQNYQETFNKYVRRFSRLKDHMNKECIFIIITRNYFIKQQEIDYMKNILLSNDNQKILFISGVINDYIKNDSKIIYKYIYYDMNKFYEYDYTNFRNEIKSELYTLFINKVL